LFNRALEEAGIDRTEAFVTNAVKHFKFEERGKRRLHNRPTAGDVALGATAAQSVFGRAYRVTQERGKFVEHLWAKHATSTVHPSSILRAPDEDQRHLEYQRFVEDLMKVRSIR